MSTTGFVTFDQAFTFSLDRFDRENPANKLSQTQLASQLGLRLCNYPTLTESEGDRWGMRVTQKRSANDWGLAVSENCPSFVVQRETLLDEIQQMFFTIPTHRNLILHGVGGTGKTVLTASFLLQAQERINLSFPDGVL